MGGSGDFREWFSNDEMIQQTFISNDEYKNGNKYNPKVYIEDILTRLMKFTNYNNDKGMTRKYTALDLVTNFFNNAMKVWNDGFSVIIYCFDVNALIPDRKRKEQKKRDSTKSTTTDVIPYPDGSVLIQDEDYGIQLPNGKKELIDLDRLLRNRDLRGQMMYLFFCAARDQRLVPAGKRLILDYYHPQWFPNPMVIENKQSGAFIADIVKVGEGDLQVMRWIEAYKNESIMVYSVDGDLLPLMLFYYDNNHAKKEEKDRKLLLWKFFEVNEAFHMCLLELSQNKWRDQMVADLRKVMKLNRHNSLFKTGRITESLAEHQAIMAAINAKDPGATAARMREHFANGLMAASATPA